MDANEARMDTNKCCEDNGFRGIRVPAKPVSWNSWFVKFVIIFYPRMDANEARMDTNKCCEDKGFRGIRVPAKPVS